MAPKTDLVIGLLALRLSRQHNKADCSECDSDICDVKHTRAYRADSQIHEIRHQAVVCDSIDLIADAAGQQEGGTYERRQTAASIENHECCNGGQEDSIQSHEYPLTYLS